MLAILAIKHYGKEKLRTPLLQTLPGKMYLSFSTVAKTFLRKHLHGKQSMQKSLCLCQELEITGLILTLWAF